MTEIIQNGRLSIPLYHGTSTLFVDSIANHGLGGMNPVKEWSLLELAKEVLLLSETHLEHTEVFIARQYAFRKMTEQVAGQYNFQHGNTYLSPAASTAIRYATNKRFGSELLTYTLDFLEELIRHEVAGVRDKLFQRFPRAFSFLDSSPSPVLIEASRVPVSALTGEDGGGVSTNLELIEDALASEGEILPRSSESLYGDLYALSNPAYEMKTQQSNFRLHEAIPVEKLRFWLINTLEWRPAGLPRVKLYEINVAPLESG